MFLGYDTILEDDCFDLHYLYYELDLKLLYSTLFTLSLPLLIIRLIWRGFRSPAYWQRWPERFGRCQQLSTSIPIIWVHAVSVGEVEASRPVVESLQSKFPDHQILITTMTPTGSARVKSAFSDNLALSNWNSVCKLHLYTFVELPL